MKLMFSTFYSVCSGNKHSIHTILFALGSALPAKIFSSSKIYRNASSQMFLYKSNNSRNFDVRSQHDALKLHHIH